MKSPIAVLAVGLAASLMPTDDASAQLRGRKTSAPPTGGPVDPAVGRAQAMPAPAPADNPTAAPSEFRTTNEVGRNGRPVFVDNQALPAPDAPPVDPNKPVVPLPDGALEPYMLTKANGPFMVLAYTFKGPDAPRQALTLTQELRTTYRLPAYILLPRKFPGKSNIRGVAPTAPAFVMKDDVGFPEIVRALDEAAVLVGDMKTVKDAADLLHQVRKLHPVCLDGVHQMFAHRRGQGLSRAIRTANPLVPAEALFPNAQLDAMVGKINDGPHNVRFCPGNYSMEIARFSGRSTFDPEHDNRFKGMLAAVKSPLASAADDAEKLAEALAKDREIQKLGVKPYVYHDRFYSQVLLGSFKGPDDPDFRQVHDRMIEMAVGLNNRKVTDSLIIPATTPTEVASIKRQIAGPSQFRAN